MWNVGRGVCPWNCFPTRGAFGKKSFVEMVRLPSGKGIAFGMVRCMESMGPTV